MIVEARHTYLSPLQLISHSQVSGNTYNTQMDSLVPFAGPMLEQSLFYLQNFDCNPISTKTSMDNKADSGLTYNLNIPVPTKRQRDSINDLDAFSPLSQKQKMLTGFLSFLEFQQQEQSEIDRYIALHMEKVRMGLEEQRKRQSRMLISAIEGGVVKKLKEKDEEIQRMGTLNWVLQERVESLYLENQIWRDVAQTNEATANNLRSNLEQVLVQAGDDCGGATLAAAADGEDEAESGCGSSDFGRCTVAGGGNRICRRCGERESTVLLLPCRHLCLCTVCGSSIIGSCPICSSVTDATLHVNMS